MFVEPDSPSPLDGQVVEDLFADEAAEALVLTLTPDGLDATGRLKVMIDVDDDGRVSGHVLGDGSEVSGGDFLRVESVNGDEATYWVASKASYRWGPRPSTVLGLKPRPDL